MNDLRTEHLKREADVWRDFERFVLAVPRDRWESPDVMPEWTVKEMLWHVAGWLDDCAVHLEQIAAGTLKDPDEGEDDTDDRNAAFASQAREMNVDEVWNGVRAARELVRARWAALDDVSDRAIEEFASETYQHYKEHVDDLERAAS